MASLTQTITTYILFSSFFPSDKSVVGSHTILFLTYLTSLLKLPSLFIFLLLAIDIL